MSRTKYEYKQVEGVNSLRLAVNFEKVNTLPKVIEAYNLLQIKEKSKAKLIADAIEFYEANLHRNQQMMMAMLRLRAINKACEIFNISTDEDIIGLLETDPNSERFKEIEKHVPKFKEPKKMLLGFSESDPKMVALHKRLFDMSVNKRIILISDSVVAYSQCGKDEELLELQAYRYVRDKIIEYNAYPQLRSRIVVNLKLMINF